MDLIKRAARFSGGYDQTLFSDRPLETTDVSGGVFWDEDKKVFEIFVNNVQEQDGKLVYNYTVHLTPKDFADILFTASSAVSRGVGEGFSESLKSELKSLAKLLAFASGAVDDKGQLIVRRQ